MISRTEQTISYAILLAFSFVVLYPVFGIVSTALDDPASVSGSFGLPGSPHFDNFAKAWTQGNFAIYLRSSAIVAAAVVSVSSFLSILAGYAFGTMRFAGSRALFFLFIIGIVVPLETLIVPLYYDLRALSLTDTYWALILPLIGLSVAFGTFWMRAFFLSTPRALVEAARIDGASTWTILWRVLVPLARPAILTMVVLIFMWTWNDFLLALVMVSDEGLRTAPLGLSFFQGRYSSQIPLLAAGSVIVAFPVVVVYVFLQRHFIRGMLTGAIKE
jgi:raffinose/stachyose/melibiose transport system permease protein